MSYLGFSTKWAASLAKAHNLDEEKQTELTYAIEVVTLNSANAFFTLSLGWALSVFWSTVVCLVTVAAFRYSAGGGHSESPWRCALVTIIIFPLLALTAVNVSTWQPYYKDLLSVAAVIVGFACVCLYAPVDNPKAPIVSPARRKRLKIIAILIMAIITLTIAVLHLCTWGISSSFDMCLIFGTLWANFNLTPLSHRLWCFIDRIGTKERRCMK